MLRVKTVLRFIIVMMFVVVSVLGVSAQELEETYVFEETGTVISYPSDWTAELENQLLILAGSSGEQIIAIDYPLVNVLFPDNPAPTPAEAVAGVAEQALGASVDEDEIFTFDQDGREVTIYTIDLALSGSVLAIEFDNGTFGLLITVEVDEDIEDAIIASFNSTEEVASDVAIPSNSATGGASVPSAYIFQGDARFIAPTGWSITPRIRDEVEYVTLGAPDNDDATVILVNLSDAVTNGTVLSDVIDTLDFDWDDAFGVSIDEDSEDVYEQADREAIQYDVDVDGEDGTLVVLRFTNNAIAVAIFYGDDADDYADDIDQLIGSFRNLGALLDFFN
ncbi:MAG: hypothetical protein AAFR81_18395 [Chloroflexota bacterium]